MPRITIKQASILPPGHLDDSRLIPKAHPGGFLTFQAGQVNHPLLLRTCPAMEATEWTQGNALNAKK
jgi:hypothetical protein